MSDGEDLRDTVNRLVAATETLAALAVQLKVRSGQVALDAATAGAVASVATALGSEAISIDPEAARALAALSVAMLKQAAAFAAAPGDPEGWTVTDPVVLQTLGRASAQLAPAIVNVVAPAVTGMSERLAQAPDVLDVGVGTAWLSIAFAQLLPGARILGIDVWQPSLDLAAENVAAAGLIDRIELRFQDVAQLDERDRFDLVWFSGPFVPEPFATAGLRRCVAALRSGGWLVYGAFGGRDPLTSALADLRTLRSGGPVLDDAEIAARLAAAGLVEPRAFVTEMGFTARFVVARKP